MGNLLALMTGDKLFASVNDRCKWGIDFVRFLRGFTTQHEEADFNRMTIHQGKLCTVAGSVTQVVEKQ